jgi:hypothetical protein
MMSFILTFGLFGISGGFKAIPRKFSIGKALKTSVLLGGIDETTS